MNVENDDFNLRLTDVENLWFNNMTAITGELLRCMAFPIIRSMNGAKSTEIQEKKD